MTNRIIVPSSPNKYTFEAIVKYDPISGQSELQIRNRSGIQISMWQVAGMLSEHVAYIMRTLLSQGKVRQIPIKEEEVAQDTKENGGDNNAS